MKTLNYYDLLEKQREEISNFPIVYAFNKEQLEEALKKLGDDEESDVFEGQIVAINAKEMLAFVVYETDYFYKERWVGFEDLIKMEEEV